MRRNAKLALAFGRDRGNTLGKHVKVWTMLTLVFALSGCAVGPDYMTPDVVVPNNWNAAGASHQRARPHLARWWTRLGDPTLNALIEEAVAGNLDVATAKARVRQARATYSQSVGSLFPTVRGIGSVAHQKSVIGGLAGGNAAGSQILTQHQAGFDASWEIDIFGKNQRGVEAAFYGVEAADEQLGLALLTLVGDVASNYVRARSYQARIDLARRTAAAQRETADIIRSKLDAGSASAADLANATGQMSTTEAVIPSLKTAYAETVHRLSVLTGRAPGELTVRMKRVAPIPRPRLPMPVGIPADILLSRPDVRQTERLLAQATAQIGRAEAARYPSINLTGNITTTAFNVGDLAKSSSIGWSIGPTLTVPLFNGGQLQAAVELTQAQRDESFVAYRVAVLRALEDVENAIVALTQERDRYGKLAAAVTSYREAATVSRSLYQAGSTNFLAVLDAERSLYTAEDALVQSRIAIATSYIALNKALGGGWDGYVDASKPEVVDASMGPRLRSADLTP